MKTRTKLIGAGVATVAAAAGTYLFYGKRGEKNRAAVADWAMKMKAEVMEEARKIKHVNQEAFDKIVDETAEKFGRLKEVGAAELKVIAADLKHGWSAIAKEL